MHKAFEYEWKGYDRKGRVVERRMSVGPILITTMAGLLLAFTGHGVWNGLLSLVQALKWR